MKPGDKVWYLQSGTKRQATIKRIIGSSAIITYSMGEDNLDTGGIRISLNRLFTTEEEIDKHLEKRKESNKAEKKKYRYNQYDYMRDNNL